MSVQPTPSEPTAASAERNPPRLARGGARAFHHHNFQLLWAGQLARGIGMWMQMVTVPWLVLRLGGSAIDLGTVTALQFLPQLFLASLGGVLADRTPKRRVLMATQLVAAIQASALTYLVVTNTAAMPAIYLLAVLFGLVLAIELPVRQAFIAEIVPSDVMMNAISLHSAAWNLSRLMGPAVAGLLINVAGLEFSFGLSAAAAIATVFSIHLLDPAEIHVPVVTERPSVLTALGHGAAYVRRTPSVHWALVLLAATSAFGVVTFQTLAPVYATDRIGMDSAGYGALVAAWGGGAVLGALAVAVAGRDDTARLMVLGAVGMAIFLGLLGLNRSAGLAFPLAAAIGLGQVVMLQNVNMSIQRIVPDALRGRVMGMYVMVQHGSNPVGAILAGFTAEVLDSGTAFAIGAVVVIVVAGLVGWRLSSRSGLA